LSGQTEYFRFPLSGFKYSPRSLELWIGDSYFSQTGLDLKIETSGFSIAGKIDYTDGVKYPSKLISPGIMGWYSFVPFMECKHGIGSVLHRLNGAIHINGASYDFRNGVGYIEKDWGTSFPESWIWLHCNTFDEPECSFTFSVAKIPWLGSFFIGHICYLYLNGRFYLFATYNHSKITRLSFSGKTLDIEIKSRKHLLKVKATQKRAGQLVAPKTGQMARIIKESVDSEIEISLSDLSGDSSFSVKGKHAGMELIEKILSYF
jgi:tocopherol cyclase